MAAAKLLAEICDEQAEGLEELVMLADVLGEGGLVAVVALFDETVDERVAVAALAV